MLNSNLNLDIKPDASQASFIVGNKLDLSFSRALSHERTIKPPVVKLRRKRQYSTDKALGTESGSMTDVQLEARYA
jgi:hypothetical protein